MTQSETTIAGPAMNAIKIEDWRVVEWKSPLASGGCTRHLSGKVLSHPERPTGGQVTTSPILGRLGKFVLTKSGNWYELGNVHAEQEENHPNAMERLLKLLPEL